MTEPIKLHIGGETPKADWKILNIQPGPSVDFVGNCLDLSQFADRSVSEIYLSHVLEHLDYAKEASVALTGFKRILVPDGRLMIGVPDLEVLSHLMIAPFFSADTKFFVMRMIYGGQTNPYDYHKAGYTFEFLQAFLQQAGFDRIQRLPTFGLFQDTTEKKFNGVPISLNVEAFKPADLAAPPMPTA
ncbi:MAG: methyltransferase domain-containing protein [Verrucomicrobia bacterium]|nr:methyltransferase domain-containing protein [Verrucomicrobiota bacterium]